MSNNNYFVLKMLFNLKPVKLMETWRNRGVKRSSRNGSGQCILYELEIVEFEMREESNRVSCSS